MPENEEIIKSEDIADGEIDAIVSMAQEEAGITEIELEKVDFASRAYYMSDIYTSLEDIDQVHFNESEKARLRKAKNQSLKILCHCVDELYKEHFPKIVK